MGTATRNSTIDEPESRHAAPGALRWQACGIVDSDDIEGVRILAHAQAHPNIDVGFHLPGDDAERALRGKDQMYAQGPAQSCQVLEQIGCLRVGRHEGVELIDDDDQPRRAIVEFEDIGAFVVGEESLASGDLGTDWRPKARKAAAESKSSRTLSVCGRSSSGENVAPPLKSMRTKFSREGGCSKAIASSQVWSSMDFPLPVVPATSAWGPSLKRSRVMSPSCPRPIVTGPGEVRAQRRRMARGASS